MTSVSAQELSEIWGQLPPPPGINLEARDVAVWKAGRILLAIDTEKNRHLLAEVPEQPHVMVPGLRGLDTQYRQLKIAGKQGTWLDFKLLDTDNSAAFDPLCADLVAAAVGSDSADPSVLASVVRRWQRFWSKSADGMSEEKQLGLFGELWLLTRCLPTFTTAAVSSWHGPHKERHDFANSKVSVEVKVSSVATGPLVHRISGLRQLQSPDTGDFYLLSLRVVSEATGAHTLDGLVTDARLKASGVGAQAAEELDEKLALYSWSPVHAGRYSKPRTVAEQALYRIAGSFPRLTPETLQLPPGITDISYSLDTAVCREWATESDAVDLLGPLGGSG